MSLLNVLQQLTIHCSMIGVMLFAGKGVLDGDISIGDFVALNAYVIQVRREQPPTMTLSGLHCLMGLLLGLAAHSCLRPCRGSAPCTQSSSMHSLTWPTYPISSVRYAPVCLAKHLQQPNFYSPAWHSVLWWNHSHPTSRTNQVPNLLRYNMHMCLGPFRWPLTFIPCVASCCQLEKPELGAKVEFKDVRFAYPERDETALDKATRKDLMASKKKGKKEKKDGKESKNDSDSQEKTPKQVLH